MAPPKSLFAGTHVCVNECIVLTRAYTILGTRVVDVLWFIIHVDHFPCLSYGRQRASRNNTSSTCITQIVILCRRSRRHRLRSGTGVVADWSLDVEGARCTLGNNATTYISVKKTLFFYFNRVTPTTIISDIDCS